MSPFELWKLRMQGQTPITPNRVSPAPPARDPSPSLDASLLHEFRAEVLDADLFQAIEASLSKVLRLKNLFRRLSVPSTPSPLLEFIVAFGPLLDQIAGDFEERRRKGALRQQAENLKAEVQKLVTLSSDKISALEAQSAQKAEKLRGYDTEIAQVKADIETLQLKLKAAEASRLSVLNELESNSTIQAKLNQESAACLDLLTELDDHTTKIADLTNQEQFLALRLEKTKSLFDRLKANLKF